MRTALVVDDHPITHLGCGQLLRDAGYEVILEAMDATEAYRQASGAQPDLIILDLGLPGVGGLNMIQHLRNRCPHAAILIFSMNEQAIFAAQALENGASGYLSKNSGPDDFRDAVKTVMDGETYLERKMALRLATMNVSGNARGPLAELTQREQQVLRLIGRGADLQSIADQINVSYKTAANVSSALKKKLGARGLPDLIRTAIQNGFE